MTPAVEVRDGALAFGSRTLWTGLDLTLEPGQFITVLGPNGAGKSSLLKAVLGMIRLSQGEVRVQGHRVHRGDRALGYVPQHRGYSASVPLRGRDLVQLGLDGTRWGMPTPWSQRRARARVDELVARVRADDFADRPLGQLSGGEQQQLRVAQAMATEPAVLLCDEPLLSLDLNHQRLVVDLLDGCRRTHGTGVLFVTHEINPVLRVTDQVLYLHDGRFRIGPPDAVMTSEVLSDLYRSPVEVIRRGNKIVVLGADELVDHDHHPDQRADRTVLSA